MNKAKQIAMGWESYARANDLKPSTKKYYAMQHAYINGVSCIMGVELPPIITIYAMTGRDIAEVLKVEEATA